MEYLNLIIIIVKGIICNIVTCSSRIFPDLYQLIFYMENLLFVVLALFLVALNGFFVAAEFGIVTLRKTRVRAIAKTSGLRGRILAKVHGQVLASLQKLGAADPKTQKLRKKLSAEFMELKLAPRMFEALIQTPNKDTKKGQFNAGGYSNPEVDKLADAMEQETDKAKRDAMIAKATKLYVDDFAYIPLHQQALVWAARKNIDLVQPADNTFPLRFVTVK